MHACMHTYIRTHARTHAHAYTPRCSRRTRRQTRGACLRFWPGLSRHGCASAYAPGIHAFHQYSTRAHGVAGHVQRTAPGPKASLMARGTRSGGGKHRGEHGNLSAEVVPTATAWVNCTKYAARPLAKKIHRPVDPSPPSSCVFNSAPGQCVRVCVRVYSCGNVGARTRDASRYACDTVRRPDS